jgi:hypothetical protein
MAEKIEKIETLLALPLISRECSIFDLTVRLASEFGQKLFRRVEYQQNLSYLGFVPLRHIGSGSSITRMSSPQPIVLDIKAPRREHLYTNEAKEATPDRLRGAILGAAG